MPQAGEGRQEQAFFSQWLPKRLETLPLIEVPDCRGVGPSPSLTGQ
jgi:hypothetical protein